MPFLKDFLINNSTKIILWKIIPGELSETHLSKEDIDLIKKRKGKNSKEYFLAVRKLLENEDPELTIDYDLRGKPFLNKQKGVQSTKVSFASSEGEFTIDTENMTKEILFEVMIFNFSYKELLSFLFVWYNGPTSSKATSWKRTQKDKNKHHL